MGSSDAWDLNKILRIVSSFEGLLEVTPESNLFDLGLDSQQVMDLSRGLERELRQTQSLRHKPTRKITYASPTIEALTANLLDRDECSDKSVSDMQRIFEAYVENLPVTVRGLQAHPGHHTVILTGSTGSLGTCILDKLINDDCVKSVYCLNRTPRAESHQPLSMVERGLSQVFQKFQSNFCNSTYETLPRPH